MKFIAVVASLVAAIAAQNIEIAYPIAGQSVVSGCNMTVTVTQPDQLSPVENIAVAITINHCQSDPCEDLTEDLGIPLYTGSFNPEFGSGEWDPFQNFTVTIPAGMKTGLGAISVFHAAFVGAGPYVLTEIKNVTVHVEPRP